MSQIDHVNAGLTKWLRQYLPDFCWLKTYDIFIMAELEFPDLNQNCVSVCLYKMWERGEVEKKDDDWLGAPKMGFGIKIATGKKGFLWKKVGHDR